ncbi:MULTISPECIES: hypothetical protein [Chryseobacterium]|uniref:Uncharacterized protein n=1 Tax=Chryseobacterium gambrini TaxID=373672 RepID=A0A1N7LDE7_9FLAO|nr:MULTISPECIES: hypothetical protein [Chryseobacterium]SIS71885.1 hypothetical protein SAMN05421785_102162 [Chryseobacterium gambrini]
MEFIEKLIVNYIIIGYLKEGLNQHEIAEKLKKENIKPNSLSSIEKRLNQIRHYYDAKTMFHLACILHNKII